MILSRDDLKTTPSFPQLWVREHTAAALDAVPRGLTSIETAPTERLGVRIAIKSAMLHGIAPTWWLKIRGVVRTLVQNRPSATQVTHKKDYPTQDHLASADEVINSLRQQLAEKSIKSKAKRVDRERSTAPPKRKVLPHPVHVTYDLPAAVDSETEETSELFTINYLRDVEPKGIASMPRFKARVNGFPEEVVLDTGACASLCS